MKKSLQIVAVAIVLLFSSNLKAQLAVNFEPMSGQPTDVKTLLESQNWQFPNFDINPEGAGAINGLQSIAQVDGVMPGVAEMGVVTPMLNFTNSEFVSFSYKLHRPMMAGCRRWFTIELIDGAGTRTLLDSVEVSQSGAIVTYTKMISGMAGTYAVFAKVGGDGCNAKLILDDFYYSGAGGAGGMAPLQKISGIKDVAKEGASIRVFPNPTSSNLNVTILSEENQTGSLEIFSMTGEKVISRDEIQFNAGNSQVNVDVQNLSVGNYIVTVKTGEGLTTKRFAKM